MCAGGTHYARFWVDIVGEHVHRDDMGGFLVPGTIFSPVGRGHLVPGVVKGACGLEDLHRRSDTEKRRNRIDVLSLTRHKGLTLALSEAKQNKIVLYINLLLKIDRMPMNSTVLYVACR